MFNPLFVALPMLFLIALSSTPDVWHAVLWWCIAVGGISVAPFLFVLRGVLLGRITDHHVSVREQRLVPLLFGIGCVIMAFLVLILLGAARSLLATMIAVLIALLLATVITSFWKVSLHLVGLSGAITAFVLLYGPLFLALSPLVLLVAWARWRVGAHTLLQAVVGAALAVAITVGVFWLFGLS